MIITPENNPITQRLEVLRQQWELFAQNPAAVVACWVVEEDELAMIEAFVTVEKTTSKVFADTFLTLQAPFQQAATYAQALLEELQQGIAAEQAQLREEGVDFAYTFPVGSVQASDLWTALAALRAAAPDFPGNLVVHLAPSKIASQRQWEAWLAEALQMPLPTRVRLLITRKDEKLSLAPEVAPRLHVMVANLDMPAAMRELAASGNPQDPGVQFRMLFVELGQAAGRQDLGAVEQIGHRALSFAHQQAGWEHMEVAVLLSVASAFLSARKFKEALGYNEQALGVAYRAESQQHLASVALLIQAHFFKAATLVAAKTYELAALSYEAVVPHAAKDPNNTFHHMEAWRMAGWAHSKYGNQQRAWECNQEALLAADSLSADIRQNSTVAYIGQALLKLAGTLGYFEQEELIRAKMVAYVGEHWEQKTPQNAVKV